MFVINHLCSIGVVSGTASIDANSELPVVKIRRFVAATDGNDSATTGITLPPTVNEISLPIPSDKKKSTTTDLSSKRRHPSIRVPSSHGDSEVKRDVLDSALVDPRESPSANRRLGNAPSPATAVSRKKIAKIHPNVR